VSRASAGSAGIVKMCGGESKAHLLCRGMEWMEEHDLAVARLW
jgi:hypothetical protein